MMFVLVEVERNLQDCNDGDELSLINSAIIIGKLKS